MDSTINVHLTPKTLLRSMVFAIISTLTIALISSSITPIIVFAEPMDDNWGLCDSTKSVEKDGVLYNTCCWKKDGKTHCQTCGNDGKKVSCGPVNTIGFQGEAGTLNPEDIQVIDKQLETNNPPISSDNSVSPNDDNNAIDEQQSNPSSPLTDQRVPSGNVGILEQLEDSSNSESGNSESSDNPGFSNVEPQNLPS